MKYINLQQLAYCIQNCSSDKVSLAKVKFWFTKYGFDVELEDNEGDNSTYDGRNDSGE